MDFDSSSKFIASLAKFLQSLCNGYVEFDKGVEVIGHIYLSVDSDTGKKIDYVLNEKVCKNDNSVTFISNSFHAQPAEKPKPPPKKTDADKRNEDSVVMDESGQSVPSSTNVGTMGGMRIRISQDGSFSPGSKRPRSPLHRKGSFNRGPNSPAPKSGMSPRYDTGGPVKMGRTDNLYASTNPMNSNDDYSGGVFQDEEDGYPSNFLNQDDQSSQDIDQKPIIDPDISIVKEEHMANQMANTHVPSTFNQSSGPGRGKPPPHSSYSMMSQNPSTPLGSHIPDTYSGSSLEGADPSNLTRAQQEELEMYYRKGTDQHLTFLRNMREAHAMYPFTGKRDKELFDKALAELKRRIPLLSADLLRAQEYFYSNSMAKLFYRRSRNLKPFSPNACPPLQQKKSFRDILYKFNTENAKKAFESSFQSSSCECPSFVIAITE